MSNYLAKTAGNDIIREANHEEEERKYNGNTLVHDQTNRKSPKLRKETKGNHCDEATCDGDGE